MKNLKRQNPGQLFVAQELINKVIKLNYSVAELRISNRYWDDKMYLFPIPDSEIRKNPNLIQNPGW